MEDGPRKVDGRKVCVCAGGGGGGEVCIRAQIVLWVTQQTLASVGRAEALPWR